MPGLNLTPSASGGLPEAEVQGMIDAATAVRAPLVLLEVGQTIEQWETANGAQVPEDAVIVQKV